MATVARTRDWQLRLPLQAPRHTEQSKPGMIMHSLSGGGCVRATMHRRSAIRFAESHRGHIGGAERVRRSAEAIPRLGTAVLGAPVAQQQIKSTPLREPRRDAASGCGLGTHALGTGGRDRREASHLLCVELRDGL